MKIDRLLVLAVFAVAIADSNLRSQT